MSCTPHVRTQLINYQKKHQIVLPPLYKTMLLNGKIHNQFPIFVLRGWYIRLCTWMESYITNFLSLSFGLRGWYIRLCTWMERYITNVLSLSFRVVLPYHQYITKSWSVVFIAAKLLLRHLITTSFAT